MTTLGDLGGNRCCFICYRNDAAYFCETDAAYRTDPLHAYCHAHWPVILQMQRLRDLNRKQSEQ